MKTHLCHHRVRIVSFYTKVLLLLLIIAATQPTPAALAQAPAPAREGNIWNGLDHQPARAATAVQEREAGVALSNEQKRQEDEDLRRIESALLPNADRRNQ